MNKQLILKYKKEFDHWLNGGKLLCKFSRTSYWEDVTNEDFWRSPSSKPLFVINDEYVEFRCALAEGKQIESQVIHACGGYSHPSVLDEVTPERWKLDVSGKFVGAPWLYRIKPDEPKFKVGDWAKRGEEYIYITKIYEIGEVTKLCHVQGEWTSYDSELWKPQPGEWVVVPNDAPDLYTVFQYNNQSLDTTFPIYPLEFINQLKDLKCTNT